jgi:hypothetical protein
VTATAEQVLEKIKSLPPADLREVCQAVLQMTAQITSTSLRGNGSAPLNGQEEDANETSFFAALDELRQRGIVRPDTTGLVE